MADTKISALTSVTTPLAGTEELPAVQSSTTKKTTVNDFFDRAVTINESGANADFRVEGDTRTHLLFVDASTDRVGINIDTPTERLDVDGNIRFGGARTDATRKLATLAGPHYTAAEEDFLALRIDAQSGGNVLSIGGSSAAHNAATYVDIYTAANKTTVTGTLALQVDPSQNVSVKTGNLVIGTSGKGIDFSATGQAAGMTSELLNDYEEGTWTVNVYDASTAGNVSSTTGTGYYTKIGDTLYFSFSISNIDTTGLTAGNTLYISLPFSAAYSGYFNVLSDSLSGAASRTWVIGRIDPLQARMDIRGCGLGQTDSATLVSHVSSGVTDILVSGFYKV